MEKYDCLVVLGDSWSYGAELNPLSRESDRFDSHLALSLNLPLVNLARESATNFCYKWHFLDYVFTNKLYHCPLVVIGVTGKARALIYNNQLDYFQESPDRLVSESLVDQNWKNSKNSGGNQRITPGHMDFPTPDKKIIFDLFYSNIYDEKYGEISLFWEIKLLESLIKSYNGTCVFWNTFEQITQIDYTWVQTLKLSSLFVNDFDVIVNKKTNPELFASGSHPNAKGHFKVFEAIKNCLDCELT